jgi:hypothetical protein
MMNELLKPYQQSSLMTVLRIFEENLRQAEITALELTGLFENYATKPASQSPRQRAPRKYRGKAGLKALLGMTNK